MCDPCRKNVRGLCLSLDWWPVTANEDSFRHDINFTSLFFPAMCPSDLQQLWKEVSGVPSSEEALKQAEGLDLSTNSSNSTSAYPKAASTHIQLHNLPNGQSHTPKRDRYDR